MFSEQLMHLFSRKPLHYYKWDSLHEYDPRRLVHANRFVDHKSYTERYDPHWQEDAYWVPDQEFLKIPVPSQYKDAYWWRERQARRLQVPFEFERPRKILDPENQLFDKTDFSDLAFADKYRIPEREVLANLKKRRQ
jgi:hypothetical protein